MDTTSAFTCLVVLVIAAVICSAIPHPQAQTDTRRILVQGSNSEFAHPQNFRRPSNTDSLNRPDESSRGQGQQPDGQWTGFHNQNSQINRTQGLGPGQPSQPHTSTIGHQGVPKAPGVQHHAAQKNLSVESVQARPSNPPLSGFQVTPVRFPGEPTQNRSSETGISHSQQQPGTQSPSTTHDIHSGVLPGKKHPSCGIFPSPGECQAAFPRYYYNASMNVCDCYIFGGCDEAEGSYRNLEECHDKCNPSIKEEGPSCKFVYIENFHPVQPGHGKPASPPSTESGNTDQVHPTNQRPSTSSHAEGERPQLPGFQVNRRPNINNTHQNAFGHVPLPGSGIPVEINPFLPFDIRSFAVIPVENGRVTSTGNTRATGSTSPGHIVRPAENPMVSLNNGRESLLFPLNLQFQGSQRPQFSGFPYLLG